MLKKVLKPQGFQIIWCHNGLPFCNHFHQQLPEKITIFDNCPKCFVKKKSQKKIKLEITPSVDYKSFFQNISPIPEISKHNEFRELILTKPYFKSLIFKHPEQNFFDIQIIPPTIQLKNFTTEIIVLLDNCYHYPNFPRDITIPDEWIPWFSNLILFPNNLQITLNPQSKTNFTTFRVDKTKWDCFSQMMHLSDFTFCPASILIQIFSLGPETSIFFVPIEFYQKTIILIKKIHLETLQCYESNDIRIVNEKEGVTDIALVRKNRTIYFRINETVFSTIEQTEPEDLEIYPIMYAQLCKISNQTKEVQSVFLQTMLRILFVLRKKNQSSLFFQEDYFPYPNEEKHLYIPLLYREISSLWSTMSTTPCQKYLTDVIRYVYVKLRNDIILDPKSLELEQILLCDNNVTLDERFHRFMTFLEIEVYFQLNDGIGFPDLDSKTINFKPIDRIRHYSQFLLIFFPDQNDYYFSSIIKKDLLVFFASENPNVPFIMPPSKIEIDNMLIFSPHKYASDFYMKMILYKLSNLNGNYNKVLNRITELSSVIKEEYEKSKESFFNIFSLRDVFYINNQFLNSNEIEEPEHNQNFKNKNLKLLENARNIGINSSDIDKIFF